MKNFKKKLNITKFILLICILITLPIFQQYSAEKIAKKSNALNFFKNNKALLSTTALLSINIIFDICSKIKALNLNSKINRYSSAFILSGILFYELLKFYKKHFFIEHLNQYLKDLQIYNSIKKELIDDINNEETITFENINYKIIKVRGDGNCFYRAFIISIIANSIATQDYTALNTLIENINNNFITIINNKEYSDFFTTATLNNYSIKNTTDIEIAKKKLESKKNILNDNKMYSEFSDSIENAFTALSINSNESSIKLPVEKVNLIKGYTIEELETIKIYIIKELQKAKNETLHNFLSNYEKNYVLDYYLIMFIRVSITDYLKNNLYKKTTTELTYLEKIKYLEPITELLKNTKNPTNDDYLNAFKAEYLYCTKYVDDIILELMKDKFKIPFARILDLGKKDINNFTNENDQKIYCFVYYKDNHYNALQKKQIN